MTALTQDRTTPERVGLLHSRLVAANAKIFQGALVMLNAAGFAVSGSTALNLTADGVAQGPADNTGGANGAIRVDSKPGNFEFANSANADLIAQANIGKACYAVDDQTVALTDGGGTRSKAGTILSVTPIGNVWVAVGIPHS